MASFQAKIGWKGGEREKTKIVFPFPSYSTGNIKLQKKRKKLKKNKKNTIVASFQDKIGWKMPRKRKNKNCLSVPFRLDW